MATDTDIERDTAARNYQDAPRFLWRLQTRLTVLTAFLVLAAAGGITYLFQRLSVDAVER